MYKRIIAIITIFIIVGILSGCGNKQTSNVENKTSNVNSSNAKKINIIVSFNPLREFTEAIGKDKVNVSTIISNGIEPHDFEPKAKDLQNINNGDIFVYNGLGMEPWAEKTLKNIDNKNLIVVEASKGCNVIKNSHEEESNKQNEEHSHGEYDPHTWLSLKEAKIQSNNIKEALIKADPSNKTYYEQNYKEFSAKLDSLYGEYKEKLDKVGNKHFVTGHAAFAYICRDFNLKQNSIEDVFAEGEPSAKKLKELVEYCKKNNVKTIFVEENVSPKVSETLAKEIGAKVEKIYTVENEEDNKDYIQSMKENLEKIYNSLK
ncbi:metal ABC transporter substrate-binding protein [Clostridium sp. JNZ J1-5]